MEDITFQACSFSCEGSVRLLNQIIERKQNLRALAMIQCTFSQWLPQALQALFAVLRRPDGPLRHFQFDDHYTDGRSNQSFSILCEAVGVSKLESFAIGRLDTEQHFTALTDAIPSMKIRELVIQLGQYRDGPRIQQTLRQAVKNNFTLQSVKYQYGNMDPFEDETLKFYLERNIRLARWVENPATVPKHLWKAATTLAAKAGAETLFRLLRKIGPEVLPVRDRKRKRR